VSHPPSRYITSNCGAGGWAAVSAAGRRGAGSYTGDRRPQRVEKDQQTAATGVDHAGVTQHVKLLGCLLQRDHRGVGGGGDRLGQPLPGVRGLLDGLTGGFQHRDDRPRNLLAAHRGDDQINPAV
jgi:hypothetical protein